MMLRLADSSMMMPVINTFRPSSPLGNWYSRIWTGFEFDAMFAWNFVVELGLQEVVALLISRIVLAKYHEDAEVPRVAPRSRLSPFLGLIPSVEVPDSCPQLQK
jgi:hypothetical protein